MPGLVPSTPASSATHPPCPGSSPASTPARSPTRPSCNAGMQRDSPSFHGLSPGIHAGTQRDSRGAGTRLLASRRLLAAAPSQKLKPASKVETRKPQHLVHVLFHVKHLKKSNLANPLFPKDKPAAQQPRAPPPPPAPAHLVHNQKLHARKQAFSSRNSHEFHRFPPTFRRFRTKHPQPEVEFSSPGFSDATAHSCKRGGTGGEQELKRQASGIP